MIAKYANLCYLMKNNNILHLQDAAMKNKFQYIFILGAVFMAAMLSGCCHATVSARTLDKEMQSKRIDNLQPIAYGEASNTGYYLFNTWPIYTGDPTEYNRKEYHSLYDDIKPGRNASMLLNAMQKKFNVKQLAQIEHHESSWGWFSLWIVWRKNIRTTAIGLREPVVESKKQKAPVEKRRRFRRR